MAFKKICCFDFIRSLSHRYVEQGIAQIQTLIRLMGRHNDTGHLNRLNHFCESILASIHSLICQTAFADLGACTIRPALFDLEDAYRLYLCSSCNAIIKARTFHSLTCAQFFNNAQQGYIEYDG